MKPERSNQRLTLEGFLELPEEPEYLLELADGLVVREPRPAPPHARVLSKLVHALEEHVREHGGGVVLTEAGFLLSEQPPTLRAPDVAFVSATRIPHDPDERSFWPLAPDLAVEVLSPSNYATEIHQKVIEYFGCGARSVWVVDPRLRTVTVYESSERAHVLMGSSELDGGTLLPGFRLPLSSLFQLWT